MAAITRVGIAGSASAYLPFLAKVPVVIVYPVLELTAYATRTIELETYATRIIELDIIALPREEV